MLNVFMQPQNLTELKQYRRHVKRMAKAFVLVEVLLSMTVLAIAGSALLRSIQNSINAARKARETSKMVFLAKSKIHEYRLTALIILVTKYKKADYPNKVKIFNFYLKNTKNVDNWDLVDLSAPKIVGDFLSNKDKTILSKLAKSNNLWERRIAILSTFNFIRNNDFSRKR